MLLDGYRLEQIDREPEIVTPVGMAFDGAGRLLVVESHTHQRPDDYEGPASDRLRTLSDSDGDGQLDHWSTYAEGFRHAMNVAVRNDGAIYIVTRSAVHLLRDTNDDGVADEDDKIVELATSIDYPHNALSGIAIDGDTLYLGVGENLGVEYFLVGSDGRRIRNVGGVGTIYTCKLDGSQLHRHADGFWNPFSLCTAAGELFCVDNDPDASPPCRLINVIEGGDYGFRFEFGRAGVHPLQAWNGELPGTLPMVCGTGEAPTAVVFHRGYVWVTSWGDYRIERYQLTPQENGTYAAQRSIVVQGDADFRPTGMAVAPDGSLWFGDWVQRSYPVHGKGRLWRLELPETLTTDFAPLDSSMLEPTEPKLAEIAAFRWISAPTTSMDPQNAPRESLARVLKVYLQDPDADVRLYAVRWIAEAHLTQLAGDVERLLQVPPPTERYYLAVLAAIDWLSREPEQRHSGIADGLLYRELRNPHRSAEIKSLALGLLSPDYAELSLVQLKEFARPGYEPLQIAAAQTLAERSDDGRFSVLEQLVRDESLSDVVRVEALAGLAARAVEYRQLLESLAGGEGLLGGEAQRILRLSGLAAAPLEDKPGAGDLEAWARLLAEPGDAAAGRRLFFSAVGPKCSACHRYSGRGGNIGPDLTRIAESNSRERILTSILDPSREVAPHFESWILVTEDGKTHVGQRLPKAGDDGNELYADTSGQRFEVPSESIIQREAAATSIMPAGLEKSITIGDLRDLVTFLLE